VDDAARAELVDWLSTWLICVAFFAAAVGFAGAMFTRCKIAHQRAMPNTPRHKCRAAWFEGASNICQFGTALIAITGGILAWNKLSHDRALRAAAHAEAARIAALTERIKPRQIARPDLLVSAVLALPSTDETPAMVIKAGTDADWQLATDIASSVSHSAHWFTERSWPWRLPPGVALYVAPNATAW